MTQKIKLLITLIVSSLLGLVAVQSYFVYTDYGVKSADFEKDINWALELSLIEAEKDRNSRLYELYLKDLKDTNLTKIEYDLSSKLKMVMKVYDAKTNYLHLTYTYTYKSVMDSMTENKLFKRAFNRGNQVFMSLSLDEGMASHRDTLMIDTSLLSKELDKRLEVKSVDTKYDLIFVHKDSLDTDDITNAFIVSQRRDVSFRKPDYQIVLTFARPFFDILERSSLFLMTSLGVAMLVFISFWILLKTITVQRKLSSLKDDFIDSVTHELLTPISTMKIALESMQKDDVINDREKLVRYLKVSDQELSRISEIVQQVLSSGMHEKRSLDFKIEKLDLNQTILDLIAYHQNRNGRIVSFSYEEIENAKISSDKQHLTNILHNLIDNAIKHCIQDLPKVKIKVSIDEHLIRILISDNGVGIPEGQEEKIFDKFHRITGGDRGYVKGLGFGLYYARTMLSKLNGKIDLLESSTKGSLFVITLEANRN